MEGDDSDEDMDTGEEDEEASGGSAEDSMASEDDVERIDIDGPEHAQQHPQGGSPDTAFANSIPRSPPTAASGTKDPEATTTAAPQAPIALDAPLPTTPTDPSATPPLYFTGAYQGGASSLIPGRSVRGCVSMLKDGQVAWKMVINCERPPLFSLSSVSCRIPCGWHG